MSRTLAPWDALQSDIAGKIFVPGSPDYDLARTPQVPQLRLERPQAVVLCETPDDVASTISFARRFGIHTAVRSGGHSFAGHSSSEGIVIDVSPMRTVSISDDVAVVGAGTRLEDLYDALDEHNITIAAGCGPSVGIAGLTLGGGLGILGRTYGLTSDQLIRAQVVLADGRVLECDDTHHEELFWGLRGAGAGNFGVVTSLVFKTVPAPAATSLHLTWPHTHAAAVIDAWQNWAPNAPDELAASLLLTASADEGQPPAVNLFGAMLGSEPDTAGLVDDLVTRAGVDPLTTTYVHQPYRETKRYLAEHGPGGNLLPDSTTAHSTTKSEFFDRPLPADATTALVENFSRARTGGQARMLDFTPWAGAYGRMPGHATAFVHRNDIFLLAQDVVVDSSAFKADREVARTWLTRSWNAVHRWGTGRSYQNFPDEDLENWSYAASFQKADMVSKSLQSMTTEPILNSIPSSRENTLCTSR